MKISKIRNDAAAMFRSAKFYIKRHSADIALGVGVTGVVVGTVMACMATTKLPDILEETENNLDAAKESGDSDNSKQIATVYGRSVAKIAINYAPSVAVSSLSIASIVWAHSEMRKRNVALAAAYTTVHQSFKQYRQRVIDKYGEDVDFEMRTGVHQEIIQATSTDENGNEVVTNTVVSKIDKARGGYSRVFEVGNPFWEPTMMARNKYFLLSRQQYFTDILVSKGYVWLNDVYRELGFSETQAGTEVGWRYDSSEGSTTSNCVDFGIRELTVEDEDYPGETRTCFVLDFNVDGSIKTKINLAEI